MAEQKSIILGTAGHVDHGKTTLVKALTGIDTDRLKEEKERGITIELGFANLKLPSGRSVGVVDVPGHEKFVKNMVAGASGMDLVALVIAADEGVMPQTTEHLEICQLLGVKRGLVVLTKTDMVDEEWLELVRDDVSRFLQGTFLEEAPITAVSSTTGKGIDNLLEVIDSLVADIQVRSVSGPYRLSVDRVFTSKGFGTVVTGTTVSGQLKVGDSATVYPSGKEVRIRGIQVHGQESQRVEPGLRTALNLQGVGRDEIKRGDVVSIPGALHPSYLLDLEFSYLDSVEKPIRHRTPIRFHTGTVEIMGRILLQGDEVKPGEKVPVQVQLEEPVTVLPGDFYVLRSYSPVRTIGGGRVLHPLPRKRKRTRADLWDEMSVLVKGEPQELLHYHIKQSGLRGLSREELGIRTGLYGKPLSRELENLLNTKQVIKSDSDGRFIHSAVYEELKKRILILLEEYHKANPLLQGLSREELRSRIFPSAPQGPNGSTSDSASQRLFQRAVSELENSSEVAVEKELVRLAGHEIALGDREHEIKDKLEAMFRKTALQPPSMEEVTKKIMSAEDVSEKGVRDLLGLMIREGRLVRLREGIFVHPEALSSIEKKVVSFLQKNKEMGVNDFRELSGGVSRKYMIPLLEYLDNKKITLRVGDVRRLRSS